MTEDAASFAPTPAGMAPKRSNCGGPQDLEAALAAHEGSQRLGLRNPGIEGGLSLSLAGHQGDWKLERRDLQGAGWGLINWTEAEPLAWAASVWDSPRLGQGRGC